MMSGLLPIILLVVIITMLLCLAAALYYHTYRNKLQKTLICTILLFVMIFSGVCANMLLIYNGMQSPAIGVLNFHYVWLGLVGLFSLATYPAVVLHQNILKIRYYATYLSPALFIILTYIVWHMATETPINYRYLNFVEVWENRYTVPVILRISMLLMFVTYLILILRNIWQLIPIYDKYANDNYSDAAHNVKWLRLVVIAIGSTGTAYLGVIIWENSLIQLIYIVVTIIVFIMLSNNAFSHKLFKEDENIKVYWKFKQGWHLINKQPQTPIKENYSSLKTTFEKWVISEKPFTKPGFSANDVYAALPELRYPILTKLLAEDGETFQSYIRNLRIEEACHIMKANPKLLCKEVAFRVGFSSSGVLSRSFIAVKNQSPMEYRKNNLKYIPKKNRLSK